MGGSVSLESVEGKGSKFKIEFQLPFAETNIPDENSKPDLKGLRVLVALNDAAESQWLNEWLEWAHCQSGIANDPREIIRLLNADHQSTTTKYSHLVIDDDFLDISIVDAFKTAKKTHYLNAVSVHEILDTETSDSMSSKAIDIIIKRPIRPSILINTLNPSTSCQNSSRSVNLNEAISLASKKTILVVDDDRTNRAVLTAVLKKFGINPDLAANGKEAVEASSKRKYDLILMDCMMPVMDGYEATRAIIENPNDPNEETPIIALTANAMKGDRETCIEEDMTDYIPKPIRLPDIKRILTERIGSASTPH